MQLFFNVDKKKRKRGRHTKKRSTWTQKFQEWFWPSIGGRAFLRFTEIKIKRAKGSSYSIAMGLAIGVFVSFLPYVGLHSGIALVLSLLLRASFIMSIIGTFIGNPWTFPLIWITTLELGNIMMGRVGLEAYALPTHFSFSEITGNLSFYFDAYLLPMTISAIPLGLLAAAVTFVVVHQNIRLYRHSREKHLKEQRRKFANLKAKSEVLTETLTGAVMNKISTIAEKVESLKPRRTVKAKAKIKGKRKFKGKLKKVSKKKSPKKSIKR